MSKQNGEVREIEDESLVKISETKKGLDILDFMRFGPVQYSLDLILSHHQAVGREDVA